MTKQPSLEDRGLLQPEEFDIDELDYLGSSNRHARKGSRDFSRIRNRRGRWLCSKCFCWTLLLVTLILIAGAALNKGGKLKIPELPKLPGKEKAPEKEEPNPPSRTEETAYPDHPITPNPAESSEVAAPTTEPKPAAKATITEGADSESAAIDFGTEIKVSGSVEATPTAAADAEAASLNRTAAETEHTKTPTTSPTNVTHEEFQDDIIQDDWTKPEGFKIIGLIFYGRRDTVSILDCYLRKNLVKNGGWLDEVHFVMNTDRKDDVDWMDLLFDEVKEYKRIDSDSKSQTAGYNLGWGKCNKNDLYIKIDDDIVFFDNAAIPNLVFSLMKHPEALNVVSTLVNSPETGWLHYRLGAIHAYLPESSKKGLADKTTAWRASELPIWEGEEMKFEVGGVGKGKDDGYVRLPEDHPGAPPFKGHRWLPLPGGDRELWRTPASQSQYNPGGLDWASWSLGAQAHYSFLQNLENDTLDVYRFGSGLDPKRERIWNMAYERMNINFMAIWGKDIAENLPFESFDDELALSVQVPTKLRRPLIVNTRAIAAHFHFRSQLEMYDTDLLDRYRAYANEKVCTKDNQIEAPSRSH